jgi:hypothetical protein
MGYVLFINILLCIVTAIIAKEKNRNVLAWVALTFIFGIFSLLVLAFLTKLKECPECYSKFDYRIKTCPYCGYNFAKKEKRSYRFRSLRDEEDVEEAEYEE